MPISDCEVRDPRIRRTRQLLQRALQSLMQTRAFDDISVQEITDAATVNRATFYDHYTDKFALFGALIEGNFHKLLGQRSVSFNGAQPESALALILATCDYITQTHADTVECSRQNAFEPLMESAMTAAIRRVLIQGMTQSPSSALPVEIVATSAAWAIYGAVRQWFYTPDHPAAEEIAPLILELLLPILQQA
ncbi:MAG TPA: TetR/AcrR family transcriptional regulator [Edaphobacter sp.]|nr:TetR/AcrR family transcriptional regulator [Edaphobacter sp.]